MRKLSILKRDFIELTGTVHNHSNYSYDCEVAPQAVIKAAYKAGLDYITINDHNVLPKEKVFEDALTPLKKAKEYDPLIIVGSELNDKDGNHHLLVFNNNARTPKDNRQRAGNRPVTEFNEDQPIESILEEHRQQVLFAAHPYERRSCDKYPLYDWKQNELLKKTDGLEIWNYTSSWLAKLNPKLNGLFLVLFPDFFVRKPFPEILLLWDKLNAEGHKLSAVGSTDAHGTKHKFLFFTISILTHKKLFKTLRTNVLLEEGTAVNKENILRALVRGNSYIVNYRLGYPYNFFAGISKKNQKGITLGEEIQFRKGLTLYYRLPKNAELALIKDGKCISRQSSIHGYFPIESAGIYRLQITRFGMGWIYTNNFYVHP